MRSQVYKAKSADELVGLCVNRDALAWSEFVDRYSGLVLWAIEDRLKKREAKYNRSDVEDIFQEVFAALWQKNKLAQLRERKMVDQWLAMVAGNIALDYFRAKREEFLTDEQVPVLDELVTSPHSNPGVEVHNKQIGEVLEEVLGLLPDRERAVISLDLLYSKKHREIAELMKLPVNTISTIIARTKERLKAALIRRGVKDF